MNPALEKLSREAQEKIRKKIMPDWTTPMLATLTHERFSDSAWLYERKLDGERCLFFKKDDAVSLLSRNRKKQNDFYPEIEEALRKLPGNFILDGELVTFEHNVTSFSNLQGRMHVKNPDRKLIGKIPVFAYLFDILYLDGYDVTKLPLRRRKNVLKTAFDFEDPLRFLPHRNEGKGFLEESCAKGWEGLIAKEADSAYEHTRSKKWLKFKCGHGQEFVIGGYTEPKGERIGFGALLLGYYEGDELRYAGRVGTGFDDDFLEDFHRRMQKLVRKTSPFAGFDEDDENITWLTPHFVGEVGFTEWTDKGRLRHPRFLGLRKDKAPEDVVREDKHAA